jgi:serine O-acetyltransferase
LDVTDHELQRLRRDLRRYFVLLSEPTTVSKLRLILGTQGIWFLVSYRLGRWARRNVRPAIARRALRIPTGALHFFVSLVTQIDIGFDTEIGAGLYIGHAGYIVVNTSAVLGRNCNLSPGVVIGEGGRGDRRGTPVIGSHVYIAPGAKIFGRLTIGDNVAVGANAVVSTSVPANAVLVGNPARIVSYRGAADFVIVGAEDLGSQEDGSMIPEPAVAADAWPEGSPEALTVRGIQA